MNYSEGPNDGTSSGCAETARRFKLRYNGKALAQAKKELAKQTFDPDYKGWRFRRNYWLDVCGHINGDFSNP